MRELIIVGDFNKDYFGHTKINETLNRYKVIYSNMFCYRWIHTSQVSTFGNDILNAAGVWFAPGTPYLFGSQVLDLIKLLRENNVPSLGTCGGFQYMLIEYALNVLSISGATSEELSPNSENMVIKRLAESLVGKNELLKINNKMSIFNDIYEYTSFEEWYDCNYEFNLDFLEKFDDNNIHFSITNGLNKPRGFELMNHPFYVGVLFIPQINPNIEEYPLIDYFISKLYND